MKAMIRQVYSGDGQYQVGRISVNPPHERCPGWSVDHTVGTGETNSRRNVEFLGDDPECYGFTREAAILIAEAKIEQWRGSGLKCGSIRSAENIAED